MGCGLNPFCYAGDALKDAAGSAASSAVDDLAKSIVESVGKAVASVGTAWVHVGTPNLTGGAAPASGAGHANSAGLVEILGWAKWIALAICIGSLMTLGAQLAVKGRTGHGGDLMGKMQWILAGATILGGGVALVSATVPQGVTPGGTVGFLQNSLLYYQMFFVVLGVIVGAGKMAWEQRAEPGKELVRGILTLVIVSGVGATAVALLVAAADSFSTWIISSSTNCGGQDGACFGKNILGMLSMSAASGPLGSIAVIILGVIAFLCTCVQIFLMIVRGGMLVILMGVLPTTAAMTNTETGRMAFKKSVGWLLAFILYKPAASIVYAAAFHLTGTKIFGNGGGDGLISMLTGLTMMVIALFAIGALMALIVPSIAQMSTGGAMVAGAVGAVAALPSGAAQVGRLIGGGSGSGGGSGTPGPSGSSGSASQGPKGSDGQGGGTGKSGAGRGEASKAGAGASGASAGAAGAAGAAAAPVAAAGMVASGATKAINTAASSARDASGSEGGSR